MIYKTENTTYKSKHIVQCCSLQLTEERRYCSYLELLCSSEVRLFTMSDDVRKVIAD